jgi:hypothetical protein
VEAAWRNAELTSRPPIHMVAYLSRRARSSAVEHLTFNQRVDGSIPSGLTKILGRNELIRMLKDIPGAGSSCHIVQKGVTR